MIVRTIDLKDPIVINLPNLEAPIVVRHLEIEGDRHSPRINVIFCEKADEVLVERALSQSEAKAQAVAYRNRVSIELTDELLAELKDAINLVPHDTIS